MPHSPEDLAELMRTAYEAGEAESCAAYAGMAAVGLLQRLTDRLEGVTAPEPRWRHGDVVRRRIAVQMYSESMDSFAYFMLQHPDQQTGGDGWWRAQVIHADPLTDLTAGQTILLLEGAPQQRVARFPD